MDPYPWENAAVRAGLAAKLDKAKRRIVELEAACAEMRGDLVSLQHTVLTPERVEFDIQDKWQCPSCYATGYLSESWDEIKHDKDCLAIKKYAVAGKDILAELEQAKAENARLRGLLTTIGNILDIDGWEGEWRTLIRRALEGKP